MTLKSGSICILIGGGSCREGQEGSLSMVLVLVPAPGTTKVFSRFLVIFNNGSANTSDYELHLLWQALISKGFLYINIPAVLYGRECESHCNHPREEFFWSNLNI